MRTVEAWVNEYSATHRHPVNILLHNICVPLIFFSVMGAIHCLSQFLFQNEALGIFVFSGVLVFYIRLGRKPFFYMLAIVILNAVVIFLADLFLAGLPWRIYLTVFILAWIGQFVGHYLEGKRPSFLDDLRYLLIGPLWLFYK